MSPLAAFAAGLLFGIGLLLSGMADPGKVKGFLDLAGAWDPSLALVMGGAVLVGFWVDSEKDYTLQASDLATGGTWSKIANVYHQMCPRFVEATNTVSPGNRFYRLVSPVQP